MGTIDRDMQDRVWQRVRGQAPEPPSENTDANPQALLLGELTDARLLRKLGSSEATNQLVRQASHRADMLRGICILAQADVPGKLPSGAEPGPAALRLLMGSLLRRHREYCRLREHGEYGPIYAELAQSAQNSCGLLAKYIGSTPLRNGRK